VEDLLRILNGLHCLIASRPTPAGVDVFSPSETSSIFSDYWISPLSPSVVRLIISPPP